MQREETQNTEREIDFVLGNSRREDSDRLGHKRISRKGVSSLCKQMKRQYSHGQTEKLQVSYC